MSFSRYGQNGYRQPYLVTISKLGVDRKSRHDNFNAQSAIRGLRTDYIRYWHVVRSLKL